MPITDVIIKFILILFLSCLLGCSARITPASKLANELTLLPIRQDNGYIVLRCTVLDGTTNETSSGWEIAVSHGLFMHSGPLRNEHFGQRNDREGRFYICVAPADSTSLERLGINIESNDKNRQQYRAAFLVLDDDWKNGSWRTPNLNHQHPGDNEGPPKYKLLLEQIPPSKIKLGELAR